MSKYYVTIGWILKIKDESVYVLTINEICRTDIWEWGYKYKTPLIPAILLILFFLCGKMNFKYPYPQLMDTTSTWLISIIHREGQHVNRSFFKGQAFWLLVYSKVGNPYFLTHWFVLYIYMHLRWNLSNYEAHLAICNIFILLPFYKCKCINWIKKVGN